jgi:hypothetical protein
MKKKRQQQLHHHQTKIVSGNFIHSQFIFTQNFCRNPTLAKCGGEAQHLEKLGVGVLRDSRMFRARQQGAKHLALGCSWCLWKGLET